MLCKTIDHAFFSLEQIRKCEEREKVKATFEEQIALRRRVLMEEADREAAEDQRRNRENQEYLLKKGMNEVENKVRGKGLPR